jgi:hypothetical protein
MYNYVVEASANGQASAVLGGNTQCPLSDHLKSRHRFRESRELKY